MSRIILLDAGPLGFVTAPPSKGGEAAACRQWLTSVLATGTRVIVPEIVDYELRRELLRAKKTKSVKRLDDLAAATEYLPLTTAAIRKAAELWALARQQGKPTAPDPPLDADVILAAQALSLGVANVVIATTNPGHLTRFVPADLWQNIPV
jgi:predicted nucleic acid-binding protein